MIQGRDGNFYGTTFFDKGTVFKMDTSGNVTVLHYFAGPEGRSPYGALIQASDGFFYGTTYYGGTADKGTVFKMDAAGNVTNLHSFTGPDGEFVYARLLEANDGNFYGTTYQGGANNNGTIFKIDASGNLTTLHSFSGPDGRNPRAGLTQRSDGNFYGTTAGGGVSTGTSNYGTVFRMDASGKITTLHSFSSYDGDMPYHELIEASDGNLYGTTPYAQGPVHQGSVFKVDPAGNVTTLVHLFSGPDGGWPVGGLIEGSDGMLYGTTYIGGASGSGTVYKMDFSGAVTTLYSFSGTDGSAPRAPLLRANDGRFYGTTSFGGRNSKGTLFRMDSSGAVTIIHFFDGPDSKNPQAGLMQATDGNFYGTTYAGGGILSRGTVFRLDSAGAIKTLFELGGAGRPVAGLMQATGGKLYGTTSLGGTNNRGTVFELDDAATFMTTLYSFRGQPLDGATPQAGLIQGSDESFYGTTYRGGLADKGTIFKIDAAGAVTLLHSCLGAPVDGANPRSELLRASDGQFYGTTFSGGVADKGTIFKMNSDGIVTVLKSFAGSDGANPIAELIQTAAGKFYGTTSAGGAAEKGSIFKMDSAGAFTTLHSFTGADGASPYAPLIQADDGNFYGTTYTGGAADKGAVFKMDANGLVTTVHSFAGMPADGGNPQGRLLRASDGKLYGTTYAGGSVDGGVVFRIDLTKPPVRLLSAVSRKIHGSAGSFDVDLPLTGDPGIEPRSGGASGDHTLVFSFANALTNVGGATVSSGTGSVSSSAIGSDAHQYIVNLTGVTNAQIITVSLTNVTDSAGNSSSAISASMHVLAGDTNADTRVNVGDTNQTKSRSGSLTNEDNFRSDVNLDGRVNVGDVNFVKSTSGTALP